MSATDQSSITNVAADITTALQSSDEQTASSLQTLSLVHQARISQVTRYSTAVTAHYGAASPEATAAQAAVSASQAVAVRSDVVNRELNTPAPAVPAGGWVLHGHVYDANGAPVSAQTVFLATAQGAFQSEYGYAYTDDTGYYSLTVDAPAVAPAPPPAGNEPAAASTAELCLAVTNQKRQLVYLSSTPFEPTAGTATYNYAHLSAGGQTIGVPPRGAKNPAPPPAPKSGKSPPSKPPAKRSGAT